MSGAFLKIIAIISMTIDHTYKLAPEFISTLPDIPIVLFGLSFSLRGLIALLGRMAFPIFTFEVAEGCRHTRNLKKYLKRLFVFALISELPFDLMFRGGISLESQNVMCTFFLGVLAVFLYERLQPHKALGFFAALLCATVSYIGRTDYRGMGVILVFTIYIMPGKKSKLFSMLVILVLYYLYRVGLLSALMNNPMDAVAKSLNLAATLLSIPVIALYNGKKGLGMKWFFYIYYPLHIIALGCVDKLWI